MSNWQCEGGGCQFDTANPTVAKSNTADLAVRRGVAKCNSQFGSSKMQHAKSNTLQNATCGKIEHVAKCNAAKCNAAKCNTAGAAKCNVVKVNTV